MNWTIQVADNIYVKNVWVKNSFTYAENDDGVGEDATPFPELLHFTLDPYLIMLSAKQSGIKYHFWVFGMTRPGIEPWSPEPLANTLFIRLLARSTLS